MSDKIDLGPRGSLKRKVFSTVTESSSIAADKGINCPICQTTLVEQSAESAEIHVNGCLDEAVLREKREHRIKRRPTDTKQHYTTKKASVEQTQIKLEYRSYLAVPDPQVCAKIQESSIEHFFKEIEAFPLKPESAPQGAYTYVYDCQQSSISTSISQSLKYLSPSTKTAHAKSKGAPRPLPLFKRIPGTSFTVDAFKYGLLGFCTAYFLTHFHSDHYGGLTKGFAGDIYCSRITANCVKSKFGLRSGQVHALPMNTRCIVHGVYVTLIDAEHCPGAAIILFEIPDKGGSKLIRIVHTGDFRASPRHIYQIQRVFTTHISKPVTPDILAVCENDAAAAKKPFNKDIIDQMTKVDYLYLDTTYLEPSYSFPKQSQVIETVGQFCYQVNQDPGYLQAHLNNIRNEKAKIKAKANSSSSFAENAVSKVSLITQWFRPAQKPNEVNSKGLSSVNNPAAKPRKSQVLFIVGTYMIGKEKLFVDIARRIQSKIYVTQDKRKLLECIASPSIMNLLTDNMYEAQVHAVSLGKVNMQGMSEYLASLQPKSNFTSIVAFSPTGWSHAGPYIPGRKEVTSTMIPELPSTAELNNALQAKDRYALLLDVFGRSAHIDDDAETDFCVKKLKPRGSSSKVTIFPVPHDYTDCLLLV
ncbi:repair protein PSO2 SNM1 [Coemansia erecta]|uniref:Repair protein PSO2 SNM1 n=1 Tax=Coemansia asiatica TaxID=1052880 RepID=A0A9W7XKW7_9FUNG|nr:repair protein PSO2 SNM1 [Coemansia asiatica]KAJ2853292.1 repair protein PSO2 SNM1 [Coemansia erecta]